MAQGKDQMSKGKTFSRIAFVSILSLLIALALFCAYNIIEWGKMPDYGYGFRTAIGIRVIGMVMETGRKAGLAVGDRILKINGKTVKDYREMHAIRNKKIGEENTYLVEREGRQFEIVIKNTPLGFTDSFLRSGFAYIAGLSYLLIGVLVFLMKPHQRTSWVFLLFCSVLGIFFMLFYKVGLMNPFFLENFNILGYAFAPAVFIHLALTFPVERDLIKKHPSAQFLPYIASALLFFSIRLAVPTMLDSPQRLLIIFIVYFILAVSVFLGSCLQLRFTSRSEIVKIRSRMILLGVGISASLPLVDTFLNTHFRVYLVPNFNYYIPFFVIFPAFIGYSIVKHNLFDFDAIIKRAYGYVVTTVSISGVYVLIVALFNYFFGNLELTHSPIFSLIFVLAVVFLLNPVRNRVQKFIDRVFFRLEYDYQEVIGKISETMRSLLNLDQIGKFIMQTVSGTMFIESGRLMLLNPSQKLFEPLISKSKESSPGGAEALDQEVPKNLDHSYPAEDQKVIPAQGNDSSRWALPANDPFIQLLAEKKKEVTSYDLQEDPFFQKGGQACKQAFNRLEATLVVPLIYEDRLSGFLSLGDKKSGKFYRREDINLLKILANQGAVAIENARLFQENLEKHRMEEELNIARDLQMSMLPRSCPKIPGFNIAATSIPAREVGGDFFDFIEMREGKLGLVVGDVTGKSVSGALVMAASRSIFRMLSEEQLAIGDIMGRANRRSRKDIRGGMFVALLYAVLDGRSKIMRFCSAGQTLPVGFSSETGKAALQETLGDKFPLGILDEADYQETQIRFEPGDRVVLYTDGIVEAMNEKKEIFGFERLLKIIEETGSGDAESILKELLANVKVFSGAAAQHDDLTAIVIAAE